MKCIVCDRCKTIIENPRRCRVITCARPLKPRTVCDKGGKVPYITHIFLCFQRSVRNWICYGIYEKQVQLRLKIQYVQWMFW